MVHEPVYQSGCQAVITHDGVPLPELQIGCAGCATLLVTAGNRVEQEFRTVAMQWHKSQFVQDQKAKKERVASLRLVVEDLGFASEGVTTGRQLPFSAASWHEALRKKDSIHLRYATIHEAKGAQYDAVCVVIPPDSGRLKHMELLFECWEERRNSEPKRVVLPLAPNEDHAEPGQRKLMIS
jgi:hypothetical protein